MASLLDSRLSPMEVEEIRHSLLQAPRGMVDAEPRLSQELWQASQVGLFLRPEYRVALLVFDDCTKRLPKRSGNLLPLRLAVDLSVRQHNCDRSSSRLSGTEVTRNRARLPE